MLQNIAIVFAIAMAIVITLKAVMDVKNANKAINEDEANQAPYKVETPSEIQPEEVVVEEKEVESFSAPAEPIPSLQEPITKPKRKRRKKAAPTV